MSGRFISEVATSELRLLQTHSAPLMQLFPPRTNRQARFMCASPCFRARKPPAEHAAISLGRLRSDLIQGTFCMYGGRLILLLKTRT